MQSGSDLPTAVSAGVTQAGAVAAVAGGISAQDVTMYGGLIVALIGLIYNMWHTTQLRKIARDKDKK